MKTTTDIAAFVKRNDNFELKILHDGKVFIVRCGEMSTRSAYLDDALENLAEAKRRQANDMQAVRETKAVPAKPQMMHTTVTLPPTVTTQPAYFPSYPTSINFQPFGAPATVPMKPAAVMCVPICPACSSLPASWNYVDKLKMSCNSRHEWTTLPRIGAVYWFDVPTFGKTKFKWNGTDRDLCP